MNQKPHYDLLIDDKAINVETWKKSIGKKYKKGIICGCFDVIHPGYIKMFKDAKSVCESLIIAIQDDPTLDRPDKDSPVQDYEGRKEIILAIKYVDEIIEYSTEKQLYEILKSDVYDVRILGTDYKGKKYTGYDIQKNVYWHTRDHSYSSSKLKRQIANSIGDKK